MYIYIFLIYSIAGHLGWFHNLAAVNSTTISTDVQVYLECWLGLFCVNIDKSAGSCGRSIFVIIKYHLLLFCWEISRQIFTVAGLVYNLISNVKVLFLFVYILSSICLLIFFMTVILASERWNLNVVFILIFWWLVRFNTFFIFSEHFILHLRILCSLH